MQILHFKASADFRRWLEKNHAGSDGVWVKTLNRAYGELNK